MEEQFLRDSSDEACLMIETNREGYFKINYNRWRKLSTLLNGYILKHKEFLFHNAPSHRKVSDDDLNADKKNGLKGKQSKRESTWNVALQTIV